MIAELAIIKYALDFGFTIESAAIAFLGYQIFKQNKHFSELLISHDKRITVLEIKKNG